MRTHTNTQVKGQRFLNEYRKQNWPIKKDTDVLWTNQKLGSNEVDDAKRGKTIGFGFTSNWMTKLRAFLTQSQSVLIEDQSQRELLWKVK